MNFFGVGIMELAIIFLVAFLVMGPLKTIEMARSAGKLIGDLRRTVNDITAAADLSGLDPTTSNASATAQPAAQRRPDPPPTGAVPTTGVADDPADGPDESRENSHGGGPAVGSDQSSEEGHGESDERRS